MTREPFIAHSELTNEIYIIVGKEKYCVTEQAIKAVMAIKVLEQEPCEDCISRQAVLEVIEREEFKGDAISEIEKLSSVAPQPKTGHWYKLSCDICYTCSFCGVTNASGAKYNYCPACGARMEVQND